MDGLELRYFDLLEYQSFLFYKKNCNRGTVQFPNSYRRYLLPGDGFGIQEGENKNTNEIQTRCHTSTLNRRVTKCHS